MSRDAAWTPSVDLLDTARLDDVVRAKVGLLADIDQRHHALMTQAGNPDRSMSVYLRATGSTSWVLPIRVQPGVTDMDIQLQAFGAGRLLMTTSADAVGSALWALTPQDVGRAEYVSTGGLIDAAEGPESGRAVTVLAAVAWDYTNVDLTISVDNVVTALTVVEVILSPIWRPRSP
jgi:hypothetical protein